MTVRFVHESLPQRVVFAAHEAARSVADEIARLGAERVMLIAAPSEKAPADAIATTLPVVHRHDEVVMHVPVAVADRARAAARRRAADAVVCVGGGSTTGLAKAVALTSGLPIVAVSSRLAGVPPARMPSRTV